MDYLEASRFINSHICEVCGGELVAYILEGSGNEVRCTNPSHKGFRRLESLTGVWRRGGSLPLYIANRIETKERRKMVEELGKETATKLAPYVGVTSLTQKQATLILKSIWPEAPEIEVVKAAILCQSYALNPLMNHLYLIPYKNKSTGIITWARVMGIRAKRLIASRSRRYSYLDGPRIMNEEEQQKILGEYFEDRLYAITILQDEHGNQAPGYGFWLKKDEPYGTDKGNTKANMAFMRSESAALDRLCPGEMPSGAEVIDENFIEIEPKKQTTPKEPATKPTGSRTPIPDKLPTRDQVKSITTLISFSQKYFGVPEKELIKELGYSSKIDIVDPGEEWERIVDLRTQKPPDEGKKE